MNVTNASYKELRDFIKETKSQNPESASFFGNYTNLGTEDLRKLCDKYTKKNPVVLKQQVIQESTIQEESSNQIDVVQQIRSFLGQVDNLLNQVVLPEAKKSEVELLHEQLMQIEHELNCAE